MYQGTVVVATYVGLATFFFWSAYSILHGKWGDRKWVTGNIALFVVAIVVMRFLTPRLFNLMVYQGLVGHWAHCACVFIALLVSMRAMKLYREDEKPLAYGYGIVSLAIASGGLWLVTIFNHHHLAIFYEPKKLAAPINVDPKHPPVTPAELAYQTMSGQFGHAATKLDEDLMDPIDLDDGIGWVVPITPDGVWNHLALDNPGLQIYDDRPTTKERVQRVNWRQKYGEDMYLWKNVQTVLYARNPFAVYYEFHYLHLNKEEGHASENKDRIPGDTWVTAAPRLRYEYLFPVTMALVWDGVTLVSGDGRFEDISIDQCRTDPRLTGKLLFPEHFFRSVIESKQYELTPWADITHPEGMIRIPEVEHGRPFPHFFQAEDGRRMWEIPVEPAGTSFALTKIYYADAHSGELFVCEFDPEAGLNGVEKAPGWVKGDPAFKGFKWVEGEKGAEVGDWRILGGTPIAQDRGLTLRYLVIGKAYVGHPDYALFDVRAKRVEVFATREEMSAWLSGEKIDRSNVLDPAEIRRRMRIAAELKAQLEELAKKAEEISK